MVRSVLPELSSWWHYSRIQIRIQIPITVDLSMYDWYRDWAALPTDQNDEPLRATGRFPTYLLAEEAGGGEGPSSFVVRSDPSQIRMSEGLHAWATASLCAWVTRRRRGISSLDRS